MVAGFGIAISNCLTMYIDHLDYKVNKITTCNETNEGLQKDKIFFHPNTFAFKYSRIMLEILKNEPNPYLICCPK